MSTCESPFQDIQVDCLVLCNAGISAEAKVNQNLGAPYNSQEIVLRLIGKLYQHNGQADFHVAAGSVSSTQLHPDNAGGQKSSTPCLLVAHAFPLLQLGSWPNLCHDVILKDHQSIGKDEKVCVIQNGTFLLMQSIQAAVKYALG